MGESKRDRRGGQASSRQTRSPARGRWVWRMEGRGLAGEVLGKLGDRS